MKQIGTTSGIGPVTTPGRLINNTLLNIAGHLVSAAAGFYVIRLLLGQLGERQYGIWVLVASIFQYRMLLCLGLNSAVNRYIPVFLAKGDSGGIARVVSTAVFVLACAGAVLAAITVVVYLYLDTWFAIQAEQIAAARVLVLIVGFSFAAAIPLQTAGAILSGIQRYDVINFVTTAFILSRTFLLIVLLHRGLGLVTTGLVFGGSEIAMRLFQSAASRKLLPQARFSFRLIDPGLLREMTAYGTNTLIYTLGGLILYKSADVIIGVFLGTSQVSRFSIAAAAVLWLTEAIQVMSSAVKPAVSDLDAHNEEGAIRTIASSMQKHTLLIIIPATCFFVVMGGDFLRIWIGDAIADEGTMRLMAGVLGIMAVGHGVRLAQHSNFIVLVGRGEHRVFGFMVLLSAALFIALSVISLKVFNMGLLSVAWSNLIALTLISGIFMPLYFCRKMRVSLWDTVMRTWVPAVKGALPAAAFIVLCKSWMPPGSWMHLGGVVLGAGLLTACFGWHLSLTPAERKHFLSRFARES